VRADSENLYDGLRTIPGMIAYKPDANFVFCRLPDHAMDGPEVTRSLFMEHNIYIKDCAGKSLEQGNRYLRIAARTSAENNALVEALKHIIGKSANRTAQCINQQLTTSTEEMTKLQNQERSCSVS